MRLLSVPRRRRSGRGIARLALLALAILAAWFGWREFRRIETAHPEWFPWTPLSLDQPVGQFTGAKLVALGDDLRRCRALLAAVGDRDQPAPSRRSSEPACGFDDAIALRPEDKASVAFTPALITACPVAAALRLWERERVQPAALRHFGQRVTAIENFGSYNCRRRYNRPDAGWSEHATGDAVDIAGFRLADGRRIRVVSGWRAGGAESAFLRDVRDGGCDLFATVLSPDYNSAHRDHFHLDQARRGAVGAALCR